MWLRFLELFLGFSSCFPIQILIFFKRLGGKKISNDSANRCSDFGWVYFFLRRGKLHLGSKRIWLYTVRVPKGLFGCSPQSCNFGGDFHVSPNQKLHLEVDSIQDPYNWYSNFTPKPSFTKWDAYNICRPQIWLQLSKVVNLLSDDKIGCQNHWNLGSGWINEFDKWQSANGDKIDSSSSYKPPCTNYVGFQILR